MSCGVVNIERAVCICRIIDDPYSCITIKGDHKQVQSSRFHTRDRADFHPE